MRLRDQAELVSVSDCYRRLSDRQGARPVSYMYSVYIYRVPNKLMTGWNTVAKNLLVEIIHRTELKKLKQKMYSQSSERDITCPHRSK